MVSACLLLKHYSSRAGCKTARDRAYRRDREREREREREMAALTTSTPWLRNQSRTMKGNDGHAGVLDDARTLDRWWSYM